MKNYPKALGFIYIFALLLFIFNSCSVVVSDTSFVTNQNVTIPNEEKIDKDKTEVEKPKGDKTDESKAENGKNNNIKQEETENSKSEGEDTPQKEEAPSDKTPDTTIPKNPDNHKDEEAIIPPKEEGENQKGEISGEKNPEASGNSESEGENIPPKEENENPNDETSSDKTPDATAPENHDNHKNEEDVKPPKEDIDKSSEDKPSGNTPDVTIPENHDDHKNEGDAVPPKEEDKKPDNTGNPNNDIYIEPDSTGGIKPYPNDITSENVKKVRPVFQFDSNFMYLMVRFKGISEEKKLWKQESESGAGVYPRGFVLGYTDIHTNQYAETHLDGYDNNLDPLPGIGYDKDFGFTDGTGAYLLSNFFYGNEHLRTQIYGNEDIKFQFRNFVIWDKLDDGIGLMGHPAFVRLNESHPLTVIVPMKDYNPDIHKNIAYITVYFELDKGVADNLYPYKAVFDGFEPK